MKKYAWLLAGVLFPIAAIAAEAPGPGWAFMTPDPNAPAPAAGGGGGGAAVAPPAVQAGALKIVLGGKGDAVRPCNTCHTPSGMGQPESANIRGLNADYFVRQMHDFANGQRGGPRAGAMAGFAKGLTDDEIKQVAAYYAELKPAKWTKVTEAEMAPKTIVGRNSQRTKLPGSDTEQVGMRVIEVAENAAAVRQRIKNTSVVRLEPHATHRAREPEFRQVVLVALQRLDERTAPDDGADTRELERFTRGAE